MKHFYLKSLFLSLLMMVVGVNVASAAPGDEIKSPSDVVSGKSYYIKGVYTSNGTEKSCYYAPTDAKGKFTDNAATDISGGLPITFTQVEGGWTLTTPNGFYVRPHTSNGQTYLVEDEVVLQLASGKTKEGAGKGIKIGPYTSDGNDWYLQCNTSNPKIGGYKATSNQWDVTLIECGDEVSSDATFAETNPSIDFPATKSYSQEVTTAEGYTGNVTYEITANTAGATIEGSTVTVTQAGSVTVKATAEPVEGFLTSTATYTLTVTDSRADNGLEFAESSQEVTVGEVLNAPMLTNPNNLTVTYSSSDESIATVDTDGNVTGVAVGTAKIIVTFEGNDQYKAGSVSYNITVKKATELPEGTLLYESVSGYTGTSDVSSELSVNYANLDYKNWASFSRVYAGKVMTGDEDGHLKFGSSNNSGKAETGSIALTGSGKLTYKVRSYDSKNTGSLTISATGADISGDTEVTGTAKWVEKTVNLTNANGDVVITFETSSDNKRIRVDDIMLVKAGETLANYSLVVVTGDGETEYPFEGNTLTKEFTGRTEFYIKDNNGKKYYGPQDTEAAIISAENHENLPTFDDEATYVLKKANTWVFTITELDASTTAGGITVTVNPQTVGETKYMISNSLTEESEDVFDENLQLTKEMDTEAFYIIRSDDYGIFELTAADNNVIEDGWNYYIWEFSDENPTVGFIAGKRTNMYRVSKPGTYTFTLDTENKTVTAQFVSGKQYTLVKVEGFGETATETEYPFEGLTLTKEFTDPSRFYIKDSDGNNYYGLQNTEYEVDRYIIRTENHENLQTVESGEEFLLKKGNTWVFTITELDAATTAGGITLTVNPETVGETKYMISYSLTEESEDVFDENLKLTKEMDTTPFYITRSDDYGIFEVTAVERTNPEGYYRFTFTEDNNTVGFKVGERRNMYEMSEAGVYDFTLDLDAKTVTAVKATEVTAAGNLNNSATGVFYGVEDMSGNGNDNKGKSATGKLTTAFGDVEVVYTVGTEYGNAYLKNDHIRMYAEGTTLKFTAPEGYVLTKIVLEKSSGNFNNLTTDVETYTNGTWEGEEESVTFTGQNGTIRLITAEVTLKKAEFVEVTISSAEWATFVTPAPVKFTKDVKAYIVTEINPTTNVAEGQEITEAPEGTPVIVNGTAGVHKLPKVESAVLDYINQLKVSDGTVTGDGTIYVLAVQGGQAGFAPLKSGKTLSEGKAYLKMENAGAKIAFVIDGEATDIRSIENTVDFSNGDWYNLQGVKVTSPQKGIYIHNGKKVVIK